MKPEEQCPTCNFNTYAKICIKGRARINQDAGGMFYKTILCPLWMAKISALVNLETCPTCGQKLPPLISGIINKIDFGKFHQAEGTVKPSEDRISELVEIEKKAQLTIPGIIPEEPPLEKPPIKRPMRRRSGMKRARKVFINK